jgi:hypothetical protein
MTYAAEFNSSRKAIRELTPMTVVDLGRERWASHPEQR